MVTLHITTIANYRMAGNIGMELNFVVGKINYVFPNFIPPTFNKNSMEMITELLRHQY